MVAMAMLAVLGAGPQDGWRPTLLAAGVTDERILRAFAEVRRADFLPASQREFEWEDRPLPIGYEQTTSQPSLIALMIQEMQLKEGCRVLEVGTGSGYQTALLAKLCAEVYSVEIVEPLAREAQRRLARYRNVTVRAGDGYLGWPDKAPFDAITVGAGTEQVPPPLVSQLTPTGRLVIPVGPRDDMYLRVVTRSSTRTTLPVRFVPLTGPNVSWPRTP